MHKWIFFVRVCDWANDVFSLVKIHRSRFLLANGFNVLVLRGLFFVCKSQYLWNKVNYFLTYDWSLLYTLFEYTLLQQYDYRVCARDVIKFANPKTKEPLKVFILIRNKRYQIYSCLQLSSAIASFVWKPAHFEFRSYGGAWQNAKIALVEKYALISWHIFAILGV